MSVVTPSAWTTKRIKHVSSFVTSGSRGWAEHYANDGALFVRIGNLTEAGIDLDWREVQRVVAPCDAEGARTRLKQGDVLVSITALIGAIGFVRDPIEEAYINQHIALVRPTDAVEPRWMAYALRSQPGRDQLMLRTNGGTKVGLGLDDVRDVLVPLPPLDVQRSIADFLDRKTASVDVLIAKQEQLLTLLAEKRQGLITQAVTKGLEPNAPTKDSGVDWIGYVPAHWKVARVRQVARLESGHTPSRQHPEWWIPEECTIPWVSLADVWKLRDGVAEYLHTTAEKITRVGLANSSARLLPARTVILSRTASVGFSAIIEIPMATTQDFVNWICGPTVLPEYLLYLLRAMTPEFARLTQGSVHRTIYMPDVARFMTTVPPLDEQQHIVAYVRSELRRLDGLAQRAAAMVDKLREYRQALITAAVTGQLDAASSSPTARTTTRHAEAVSA